MVNCECRIEKPKLVGTSSIENFTYHCDKVSIYLHPDRGSGKLGMDYILFHLMVSSHDTALGLIR